MPDDLGREPVTIVGDALHPPTLPHKPRVAVCLRDNARCDFGKHSAMKSIRECLYSAELDMRTSSTWAQLSFVRPRYAPEVPPLRLSPCQAHLQRPKQ